MLFTVLLAGCAGDPTPCSVISTAALASPLREASGVAIDLAGRTWALADSGEPVLYQVADDGSIIREVRIPGTRVVDWEDLAIGTCPAGECFFIGEIGDNLHERPHREILRVAVPTDAQQAVPGVERLRFRYPDGPADAEALVALPDGSLLVVTKGRNRAVGVYRYAPPWKLDEIRTLDHVQDLTPGIVQLPEQVTGGAAAGERVLLRTYTGIHRYDWTGDSLAVADTHPLIDIRFLAEEQGEGVAAAPDGTVTLVSEGQGSGSIVRLRCGDGA